MSDDNNYIALKALLSLFSNNTLLSLQIKLFAPKKAVMAQWRLRATCQGPGRQRARPRILYEITQSGFLKFNVLGF